MSERLLPAERLCKNPDVMLMSLRYGWEALFRFHWRVSAEIFDAFSRSD